MTQPRRITLPERRDEDAAEARTIAVVSPCGSCREIIHDDEAQGRVIVPTGGEPTVAAISELLPNKYVRGTGRW
jgi:cytidine deaminase